MNERNIFGNRTNEVGLCKATQRERKKIKQIKAQRDERRKGKRTTPRTCCIRKKITFIEMAESKEETRLLEGK